jgi:hypothetical protein
MSRSRRHLLVSRCCVAMHVVATMILLAQTEPMYSQVPARDSLPSGRSVAVRLLSHDSTLSFVLRDMPGLRSEGVRRVIRDQSAWDTFWSSATVQGTRVKPEFKSAPPVDFARDMVIVAGNGLRPSGSDIAILGAVARGDSLYVLVRSRSGVLPGCINDELLNPLVIDLVPKTQATVVFVETVRNEWCGHSPQK